MIFRTGAPDDIPALQVIEKKARIVYAALAGFEFGGASPPIAADRFILGTTFIAEVSESLVGFALIQPMGGSQEMVRPWQIEDLPLAAAAAPAYRTV